MNHEHPQVRFVTRPEELAALIEAMNMAHYLPLDTEFVRERTYFPQLALLQIATTDTVWLVDPIAGLDLTPFWHELVVRDTPVVLHAGDQDLDLILTAAGRLPPQVFDTQVAAELLGIGGQLSYAALTEALLGTRLDKGETRSDWLARPLSETQLNYAVQDVAQLHALYPRLEQRLDETGRRDWMTEEMARQCDPARFTPSDEQRWQKIRGVQTLNRAGLAVLQVLAAWRERLAREQDRPRRWVWGDQAMLDLAHAIARQAAKAEQAPSAAAITDQIARARSPFGRDSSAQDKLGQEIAAALGGDCADWPRLSRPPAMPPAQRELVKSRQSKLVALAEEQAISPSRLATSAELRQQLANPDRPSRLTQGWRAQLLAPILQAPD
ncbi:HRDC domain-containing protein [Guyparkeria halophila]|uniref:HRDC domain-containing protein n=1 Tax=Guyparkeria halophila TaxID=47960 RepID=A0ABZ0YWT5_9GAMM|nr:HRDC domain-containing protein [Guyparkeria halophila]WQH16636.1 HRDC domain-containing protein [Guyparkeria halophila]